MSNRGGGTNTAESYVPSKMHRLPFSRWHVLVIAALGVFLGRAARGRQGPEEPEASRRRSRRRDKR